MNELYFIRDFFTESRIELFLQNKLNGKVYFHGINEVLEPVADPGYEMGGGEIKSQSIHEK